MACVEPLDGNRVERSVGGLDAGNRRVHQLHSGDIATNHERSLLSSVHPPRVLSYRTHSHLDPRPLANLCICTRLHVLPVCAGPAPQESCFRSGLLRGGLHHADQRDHDDEHDHDDQRRCARR